MVLFSLSSQLDKNRRRGVGWEAVPTSQPQPHTDIVPARHRCEQERARDSGILKTREGKDRERGSKILGKKETKSRNSNQTHKYRENTSQTPRVGSATHHDHPASHLWKLKSTG